MFTDVTFNEDMKADLRSAVLLGEKMSGLIKTEGWKLFEEELLLRLKRSGNILRKAEGNQVYKSQGEMDAIESILSFATIIKEQGIEASKELENIKEN